MTQYIERECLKAALSARTDQAAVALARELGDDQSHELVPVTAVDPETLLPTYRARLERSLKGDGPATLGLVEWVAALESRAGTRVAMVRAGSLTGICLFDEVELRAVSTISNAT